MRRALAALLVCLAAEPAFAWGTDGHESIVRLAVLLVREPCLERFLGTRLDTVLVESMAPDRWKGVDPDEPPRHYLDIDASADPAAYPRTFAEAAARFGSYQAMRQGLVPWRTDEFERKLEGAFAAGDRTTAAQVAGQLAHYVGDAYSPLHATVNFDGQFTGDLGLHERFEVEMPKAYGAALLERAIAAPAPPAVPDAVNGVFEALLSGTALVPGIVAADVASAGGSAAFFQSTGELVAARWASAAALLVALWTQAWVDAGRPELDSCAQLAADAGTRAPPRAPASTGCAQSPGALSLLLAYLPWVSLRYARRWRSAARGSPARS